MHESGLAQSRLTEMSAYLSALTRSGYTPGCRSFGKCDAFLQVQGYCLNSGGICPNFNRALA
jgi:hypothetical protein